MTTQFGRQAVLQFGPAGGLGRSVSGLRVRLKAEYSRSKTPHSAVCTVWGLSDASFGMLQDPTVVVRVLAGYQIPLQVFRGTIVKDGLDRDQTGSDSIVTMELQDGGTALRDTHISISFATETTLQQLLDVVLAEMGIPPGAVTVDTTIKLTQGVCYTGSASKLLDRIALASNADWFISDGAMNVLPRDGSIGDPAVVFSADTRNLIGYPKRRSDGKVEAVGLLAPTMRPGRRFQVISHKVPMASGTYVAEDVVQELDSGGWELPFYTHVVGRPLVAA